MSRRNEPLCRKQSEREPMKLPRRKFLHLAAGAAALPAMSSVAMAQTFPTRPVHLIVSFAAGGPNDTVARLIGQWLSERLRPPFLIVKPPGARGNHRRQSGRRPPPLGFTP